MYLLHSSTVPVLLATMLCIHQPILPTKQYSISESWDTKLDEINGFDHHSDETDVAPLSIERSVGQGFLSSAPPFTGSQVDMMSCSDAVSSQNSMYVTRAFWALPQFLTRSVRSRDGAYTLLHRELKQDFDPQYNLATFVSTHMDPEATLLIAENMSKNFVDPRAYPIVAKFEQRCLRMIADLYHYPDRGTEEVIGMSTVGSSEAIMIAVLAMKTRWLQRQAVHADNKLGRPNIIISSVAQVCWPKAARYFDIDLRYVPCSDQRHVLDPVQAVDLVNDQTIGIACIL